MATTDEREAASLDAPESVARDGDDITVVPGAPPRRALRGRPVLVGAVTVGIATVAVIVGLALRSDGSSKPAVQVASPPSSEAAVAKVPAPPVSAPRASVAVTTPTAPALTPTSAVKITGPRPANAVSPAPTPPPAPAPTVAAPAPTAAPAPPPQFGASFLTWDAPRAITIKAGATKTISVVAHNPTNGVVTLPHPLSCAPRLDHSEICAESVQLVASGASAGAQYTIDATGTAAGQHYTLNVEGVLSIAVTIS